MKEIKAVHQLVVNGEKPTDPSRVIEPGKKVFVSAEDAERFIELGAAVEVAAAEDEASAGKKGGKKPAQTAAQNADVKDDGLV